MSLEKVAKGLEKAATTHAGQAKEVYKHLEEMKAMEEKTPAKKIKKTKISPACKAAAKRKFKVWPSAYASGWGVRCTRNPKKYLGRKKK